MGSPYDVIDKIGEMFGVSFDSDKSQELYDIIKYYGEEEYRRGKSNGINYERNNKL